MKEATITFFLKTSKKEALCPDPDSRAAGNPHTIIQVPGIAGSYTTYNGDGTYKQ